MSTGWREALADAIEMQAERIEATTDALRDCLGLWETGSEMDAHVRRTVSLLEQDSERRHQQADGVRGKVVELHPLAALGVGPKKEEKVDAAT